MEGKQYQVWVNENEKNFPEGQKTYLLKKFSTLNEEQFALVAGNKYIDTTVITIVSVVVGFLGVDRFMLGDIGLGILKLCTGGGGFIWWVIDWFIVGNKAKEQNMKKLNNTLLLA